LENAWWFKNNNTAFVGFIVGQAWKPDRVLTIDIIHAVDRILENEWEHARRTEEQKCIAEMGAWFIGGFCTGLRGEEMLLIKLAGTANNLKHMTDDKNAHFVFVISGSIKGSSLYHKMARSASFGHMEFSHIVSPERENVTGL
jgi:hypothetical protein